MTTIGSLFTGYGGLDMAVRMALILQRGSRGRAMLSRGRAGLLRCGGLVSRIWGTLRRSIGRRLSRSTLSAAARRVRI